MTNKRLKFAISDAKLLEDREDSRFALVEIDFFASGDNRHELFVSEDTLLRTSETIKNCPIVWKYSETFDDIHTHDKDEVPCGFVPKETTVTSRRLPDGRLMLSCMAYVWKRYSGRFLEFFKRDGDKPVSVEMEVKSLGKNANGINEIFDYVFEAITCLGSLITPAIPDARMGVVRFSQESKEYQEDLVKEFAIVYDDIDFTIPEDVKNCCAQGLSDQKGSGKNGSAVANAFARNLIKSKKISPERVRQAFKYFKKSPKNLEDPSQMFIWNLYGGSAGEAWINGLHESMQAQDDKRLRYFNSSSSGEELRGNNKEDMGVKKDLENLNMSEEPQNEKPEEAQEFSEEMKEEKKEDEAQEQEESQEKPEDDEKEESEGEKEEFSLDAYIDVAATLAMLEEETEENADEADMAQIVNMAVEELKKEGKKDFGAIVKGMFCKMAKMSKQIKEFRCKMSEDEKASQAYMDELTGLRQFKKESDDAKFKFAVDSLLKSLSEKVNIPQDVLEQMKESSLGFSLETLEEWENSCKAKALDFAVRVDDSEGGRYGLPWQNAGKAKSINRSPYNRSN